ncbi:hypothetical protein LTS15_001933 [Exophiala xenobiotica]|nr:hypothetical protein LTS15_001933 [Exophiala xenobiotica]
MGGGGLLLKHTMNGITEPLPGLLDDPQFQITDLPALTDFQIAPLRNPAPTRHANVPLPLEPLADNILNNSRNSKNKKPAEGHYEKKRGPKITPNDVLLAREAKKPHLAISELLDANNGPDIAPTQLPSFISLSVVERSPIQAPTSLYPSNKRAKLDVDPDHISLDLIRRLPRPAQKDDRQNRPAPLLPAMVTGLHEPPPSAALLPSIDVESRPAISRSTTATAKIHVKDILTQPENPQSTVAASHLVTSSFQEVKPSSEPRASHPQPDAQAATESVQPTTAWDDKKQVRRPRRKWSDDETRALLAGVKKYGVGKWKQILDDTEFNFLGRSSVDLKDRYRVCITNNTVARCAPSLSRSPSATELPAALDLSGLHQDTASPEHVTRASLLEDLDHPQKQRRRRRAWTDQEDANLLRGVAKHGFQWTAIHDDSELDLGHRKATDLRDRIRNKFPDGYRQAESAPLKSEVKRAEKRRASPSATTGVDVSKIVTPIKTTDIRVKLPTAPGPSSTSTPTSERAAEAGQPPRSVSHTTLAMLLRNDEDAAEHKDRVEKEKERDKDQPGVTLPSFTLDVDDDMDWGDNTLPPLHEWEEIGI